MNATDEKHGSWVDYLALGLAFLAAVISFWGAFATYAYEGQVPNTPLWPLPGLILSEWVLLGLVGFILAYLCTRGASGWWLRAAWIITGTFIPLIVLGAFSIGAIVLVAFLLLAIATSIYSIRRNGKLLESFGFLMLGSIVNLGILSVIITLSNQNL